MDRGTAQDTRIRQTHTSQLSLSSIFSPSNSPSSSTSLDIVRNKWGEYPNDSVINLSYDCINPRLISLKSSCGHKYSVNVGCHKRFHSLCPECAKRYVSKRKRDFKRIIDKMQDPRFITLTLRYNKLTGICPDYKNIWSYRKDAFKMLRNAGYKIKCWIAVFEWPNHLHLVYDGSYIAFEDLTEAWRKSTGGSYIVNIQRLNRQSRSPKSIARYLAKYMSKDSTISDDFLEAFKGFHMYQSNGLDQLPKKPHTCPCCGKECTSQLFVSEFETGGDVPGYSFREELLASRQTSRHYTSVSPWVQPKTWTHDDYLSALYKRKVSG